MNLATTSWSAFLAERGAVPDGAAVAHFGNAPAELAAARDEAVLCDLAPVGALAVTGAEAATFLQGQVTSDVTGLAVGAVQRSAWCNPKGRVAANFLLRRASEDHFELLLPASLAGSIAKRLRMYVLRAKVSIADASDASVRLGVGGPAAAACIAATITPPPAVNHAAAIDGGTLIALSASRFLFVATPGHAPTLWNTLSARARPAGFACWAWLTVRAAVPIVTPPTQEAFLPQMLNLDALDAIAFGKGCYTGQEIVARTQYLGRLKERLVLAHVEAAPPAAADRLFAPSFGVQPCGTVVNAAPCPDGGADFLAVAQVAAVADAALRLDAPDGPALALLPLPYALPATDKRPGRIV
jgi:hypothetical protein